MTLTAPLGLLALLAIPAIIAIHLLRRKFPVRPVAGLFLWERAAHVPDGGRRVDRLPVTTSLILECLAALALALILAGARLSSSSVTEHLVVLLDDSASMAAVNAAGESARDRAARRILEEVDRIGLRGLVTFVRSGERPAVLAGPGAFAAEAARALERWSPAMPHHSLAPGLRLARELAGENGRLMVLTDGPPASATERAVEHERWIAVGRPLPNVAITDARRTVVPEEGRGAVSLALQNFADSPARRVLRVTAGASAVATRELDLPPGASSLVVPLPPGLPAVRVTLSDDALAADNEVILVEPRPQVVGVENRLAQERGREALGRAIAALSGVTTTTAGHLVFADAREIDVPTRPGVWRVLFGEPPAALGAAGDAADYIGPFVLEKRHPLLQGITLGGIVWSGAVPLAPGGIRPIVSAADRGLVGVIAARGPGADPAILFNLDLERTNLVRSPDWPILVSNLVEMRRRELPGPERWNYRVGEWIRVRFDRQPEGPVRLRAGDVERDLPGSRTVELVAPAPGGLVQILDGDEVLFELGVNALDAVEGDLRGRTTEDPGTFDTQASGLRAESGAPFDPLFWILLAIGAGAMVGNWCLPRPRMMS